MLIKPPVLIAVLGLVMFTSLVSLGLTLVSLNNTASIDQLESVEAHAHLADCITLRNLETKLLILVDGAIEIPRSVAGLTPQEVSRQEAIIELYATMRGELMQELQGRGCIER
jgi:hypothetical protein